MSHLGTIKPTAARAAEPELHATGLFVVLCLLVGGGTDKGIGSDLVLQVMALPFIFAFVMQFPSRALDWPVTLFIAAVLGLMVVQLIPTFGLNGAPFLVTVDAGRSLDSLVMVLAWIGVFHAVTQMKSGSQAVLMVYVLAGMLLNFLFSFIQFASSAFADAAQFLPYTLNAGFFENENHLSALFYICAPIIIVLARRIGIWFLAIPLLAVLLGFQFVIGSKAGLVLIAFSIIVSYAVLSDQRWVSRGVLALTLGGGAYLVWHFLPAWWGTGGALSRSVFAERAIQAALDHLPFGVGFGNFQLIYPSYETPAIIVDKYVNHAHNDYLELFLEGSVGAVLLLLAYFALLARQCFKGALIDMQKAAVVGIIVISIHSLVDYPLRTLALGIVFAILNALVFSSHSKNMKIHDEAS
ncbi:MAG: O-antigen ligase family protein [Pseudomonadota bacterium]